MQSLSSPISSGPEKSARYLSANEFCFSFRLQVGNFTFSWVGRKCRNRWGDEANFQCSGSRVSLSTGPRMKADVLPFVIRLSTWLAAEILFAFRQESLPMAITFKVCDSTRTGRRRSARNSLVVVLTLFPESTTSDKLGKGADGRIEIKKTHYPLITVYYRQRIGRWWKSPVEINRRPDEDHDPPVSAAQ